jgi:hypothetical protein
MPASSDAGWWKRAWATRSNTASFADSDGDGFGGLGGVFERLDHRVDLGSTSCGFRSTRTIPRSTSPPTGRKSVSQVSAQAYVAQAVEEVTVEPLRVVVGLEQGRRERRDQGALHWLDLPNPAGRK